MEIKGITVTLIDKVQVETDEFDRPVYQYIPIDVENVLISPTNSDERLDTLNLTGKHAVYTLAIPKGDTHVWKDRKVQFFGETWNVIGFPTEGIDSMIPLEWNKKVQVERYG